MTTFLTIAAVYFIIWWLTLFTVLPWFNRSAYEAEEEIEAGHAPSAPMVPRLGLKFGITTLLSAVIFALGYSAVKSGWLNLDAIPFLPEFRRYDQ